MEPWTDGSSFPMVDVSQIDDPDLQIATAKAVTSACKNWGFLLIKNHSIPSSTISQLFSLGKEFFSLPESEKEPWPINAKSVGYMGSFKDRMKDDKMSMWFGGLPYSLAGEREALPPFWRERTKEIDNFKHRCHELVDKLLICFALALGLPDKNFFAASHAENTGEGNSLRMLMYPARKEKPQGTRMQPHTDSGSVTLLFQTTAGLEVLSPSGEWVKAPSIEGCILVNIGDALAFWSGNQLKATLHRVTFDGVPHEKERQTMAYSAKASPETVLQPIFPDSKSEEYVSNGIKLRPGITVGELSSMIMKDIYGSGSAKEIAV